MSVSPASFDINSTRPGGQSGHGNEMAGQDSQMIVTPARLVMWTILFQIAWSAKKLPGILQQGIMPDPDDFLRLQQIRNWMQGHGWFDVSVPRMDPQFGAEMHWSRLVDAPIALLIKFFAVFTDVTMAERLASILWPTILLVCLVLVMSAICDRVVPAGHRLITLLFTVMCIPAVVEFAPGRIDHHSVQILLFSLALLGLVSRDTKWGYYLIGAAVGTSIGIGIDTFLLLLVLLGFLGMDWALGRDKDASGLVKTGTAMSAAALIVFFLSVPPQEWQVARVDAISIFFVTFLLLVSAGFAALYLADRKLPRSSDIQAIALRAGTGVAVAVCIAAAMFVFFGDVLTGGFVGLNKELQTRWLNDIVEAMSLPALLAIKPEHWVQSVVYFAVLIAAGAFLLSKVKESRQHLITIYAMMVLSIVATLFQFRLLRTGIVASIPVCVALLHISQIALRERFANSRFAAPVAITGVAILLLPLTWVAFSLAVPNKNAVAGGLAQNAVKRDMLKTGADKTPVAQPDWRKGEIYPFCNQASQYKALAAMPKGMVINDLNSGPPVLVFTGHNILAGNYHRNGRAILQTLDFFETDAIKAKQIARTVKADYVVFCDSGAPVPSNAGHSGKLAARILNGKLPSWLQRVSPPQDRLIILKVLR